MAHNGPMDHSTQMLILLPKFLFRLEHRSINETLQKGNVDQAEFFGQFNVGLFLGTSSQRVHQVVVGDFVLAAGEVTTEQVVLGVEVEVDQVHALWVQIRQHANIVQAEECDEGSGHEHKGGSRCE